MENEAAPHYNRYTLFVVFLSDNVVSMVDINKKVQISKKHPNKEPLGCYTHDAVSARALRFPGKEWQRARSGVALMSSGTTRMLGTFVGGGVITAGAEEGRCTDHASGASTGSSLNNGMPRSDCLPPLIPPFRFCMVEDGVYRGAHPSLKNMRYLRRLQLRTIISLVPDPSGPTRDLVDYCNCERIRHRWEFLEKYDDDKFSHTPQLVASLISDIVDIRNHPIYIHCRDGAHNTGLVIMCLRRLQNWALPTIYNEFRRYTKSNFITYAEKRFVESFRATVTIPVQIPGWLWCGTRYGRHPSIELLLERDAGTPNSSLQSPSTSIARELNSFTSPARTSNVALGQAMVPHMSSVGIMATRQRVVQHRYDARLEALDLHGLELTK